MSGKGYLYEYDCYECVGKGIDGMTVMMGKYLYDGMTVMSVWERVFI